jgi:hypothetical protein
VSQPVDTGVPIADLPLLGKFYFSAILHSPEFLRRSGPESIDCGQASRLLRREECLEVCQPSNVNQTGRWQGQRKHPFT